MKQIEINAKPYGHVHNVAGPVFPREKWNELVKNGQAFLYRNGNWKDDVYVMFCSPDEVRPFLPNTKPGNRCDPDHVGGLSCGIHEQVKGRTLQYLWVRETNNAWLALRSLVHEAIHAAAFALYAREIPLDLKNKANKACLGFFIEDLLSETLPFFEKRLGIRGADVPRMRRGPDRRAIHEGKSPTMETMKQFGIAFDHEDKTWRSWITAVICNADDADTMLGHVTEPDFGCLDEDSRRIWFTKRPTRALVWADGSQGARAAFASLAHSAISAAGTILSDCGVDVDVSGISASECVAYFVECFFENIRSWFLSRFAGTLKFPNPGRIAT